MNGTRLAPMAQRIEEGVRDVPGWSPIDQLFALNLLVSTSANLAGDVLEVGSWCGRSAIALALGAAVTDHPRVHCIDLFPARSDWFRNDDGSYSMRVDLGDRYVDAYHEQTVWAEPFERDIAPVYERYESVHDAFLEHTRRAGVGNIVLPFKGCLSDFLRQQGGKFRCRMAFLDGHHSYRGVMEDIDAISPHMVTGGWLCFDDAFSGYEGVDRAIGECVMNNSRYDFTCQLTRKLFVARVAGA
jgi:hypothetical protein